MIFHFRSYNRGGNMSLKRRKIPTHQKLTILKCFKRMTDIEREAIFPLLDDKGANFLFEVYNNSLFNTPKNINSRKVKLLQKKFYPFRKEYKFIVSPKNSSKSKVKKILKTQKGGQFIAIASIAASLLSALLAK